MAIWIPDLTDRRGPAYRKIVDAMAADIRCGTLPAGTRLPPHRELAYRLGVSPNTTSRAYAEGVKRGLIQGEVGRGTFVRPHASRPDIPVPDLARPVSGPIDFAHNLPAPGDAAAILATTLSELSGSPDLQAFLDHRIDGEVDHHIDAARAWLARNAISAAEDETVITSGAQHGILSALMAATVPGDILLTETLTYAPVKAMANRLGLHIVAVDMDAEGLCPDSLDALCRTHRAKALYLTPTLQTPTTITLNAERRSRIAEIAARHGLTIIEDDVFGQLKPDAPPPVATLAPDRTVFITSTSKYLTPGLRVGFLHAPSALAAAIRVTVAVTCWMTPPLMVELAARWIADGTADRLTGAQQAEAAARQTLARDVLGRHKVLSDPHGFHLWLPLPAPWLAHRFTAAAHSAGVDLVEGAAFSARPAYAPNAVRLCLAHEATRERVAQGLTIVKALLDSPDRDPALVV